MEPQGYVLFHRSIIGWEWYTNKNVKSLFFHLLLIVNHKDNKWRGKVIKRGSCITSYSLLSMQTGLSIQEIRTAFNKLEETGEVTRLKSGKSLVVMVTNYDRYQSVQHEINTKSTSYQHDVNTISTTNNNEKNDKNEKNNKKDILSVSDDTSLGGEKTKDNIPYKEIIDYLNEKAETKYRYQTTSTKEKIRARYREGYTIDDFKTVIDNKCAEWKNDEKMCNYLRPETLFGTKFESYLNQNMTGKMRQGNGTSKEHDTRTVDSFGIPILR